MSIDNTRTASSEPVNHQARSLKYVQAATEALSQGLARDRTMFVAGEDVVAGGVYSVYKGLADEHGRERVLDTPVAEAALAGLGVGSAACGCRPVIDIMFMDFIGIAMDQLVNQAAKMKYMFGGSIRMPLTILTVAGAGTSSAAQHSQSLEAWLCHVPGLKVVMPSGPYEVKGLLRAALDDDNATVVMLNKRTLGLKAHVPEEAYTLPLGVAAVVRTGHDVTIVAMGRMVLESIEAASTLAAEGIDVEVIDVRTPSPLDIDTILESVRRTNRVVVAHEAVRFGGFGGEIAAQIQEEAFDYLDAPIGRVGAPFSPVPFAPELERLYVPSASSIAEAVRATVAGGRW
ncbi:MAG: alpha-ketoacid dehydrogenase subunit beta [Acidimicrobiaceae bacterium]|nr:alpha-ketoacid dehydrogenase subunit beta [Acidimicrobiaceae bacterium]